MNSNMKKELGTKLFNGNVIQPFPMALFAAIVGIALLAIALWATFGLTGSKDTIIMKTDRREICSYKIDGPACYFKDSKGCTYDIPSNNSGILSALNNLVANNTGVIIEYAMPHMDAPKSLKVLSIVTEDGMPIIGSEELFSARSQNAQNALIVLWSVTFCYLMFCLGSWYILYNAPRYPRIASLLIRSPYRNF